MKSSGLIRYHCCTAHKGTHLAAYAGEPIFDADVVDMGTVKTISMRLYAEEYKIWYGRAKNQKKSTAFKAFWENQVRIKKFTTNTAGQMDFGMDAQEEEFVGEYENACINMA